MAHNCAKLRRKLVTHYTLSLGTGERKDRGSEWVTEACGTPLFSAAEREAGVCRSCASGWRHPNNYPADEERPAPETSA